MLRVLRLSRSPLRRYYGQGDLRFITTIDASLCFERLVLETCFWSVWNRLVANVLLT